MVELRHGEHPTILGAFFGKIFLPLDRWTCPIKFLRFLFLLYANTGRSENVGAMSVFVWRIDQCLLMIRWMGGEVLVKRSGEGRTFV